MSVPVVEMKSGARGRDLRALHRQLVFLHWLVRRVRPLLVVFADGGASGALDREAATLRRALKHLRAVKTDSKTPPLPQWGNPVDLLSLFLVVINIAVTALLFWLRKVDKEENAAFRETARPSAPVPPAAQPTQTPLEAQAIEAAMRAQRVRNMSRAQYARTREEVERDINRFLERNDVQQPTLHEIAARADAALMLGNDSSRRMSEELLRDLGIEPAEIETFIRTFGPPRILRQLMWLPERNPRHPIALLRRAVAENFASPHGASKVSTTEVPAGANSGSGQESSDKQGSDAGGNTDRKVSVV